MAKVLVIAFLFLIALTTTPLVSTVRPMVLDNFGAIVAAFNGGR